MTSAKQDVTSYADDAFALINEVRAMRDRIPNFAIPSRGDGRRLAPAASVPPEFIELTAVAITTSKPLKRGGAMEPDRSRDAMRFASAYHPLAEELEAMAHFVRHTITAVMNEVGSDALATYALAKRLAKRPATADLLPHVEHMRRALGRGKKRKSNPAAAETDKDSSADGEDGTQIKPS
jgi:hypothetical protein